jgi:twitching motility protein PilU
MSEFDESQECNFSIALPGVARFRVNAFVQRGSTGLVLRIINSEIPTFTELHLPDILQEIAMTKRGLVIFVGSTGSGKSTSLASMVNYRNRNSHGHIITIEDPVEFVHEHINCLVTQREVGVDTETYAIALKNTLRQAPDVILIGEVRDRETMEHAIAFAETGHLCLTTLHANSTNQALDRIINFFPDERRTQLLMDLSLNLKSLISQRLIPKIDGVGRIPATEVMINTPLMTDMIFKGEIHEMKSLMAKSNGAGMKTFDQALFELYEDQKITFEDALRNADSINDLRLRIKLESNTARKTGVVEDHRDLEMEESDDNDIGLF